MANEITVNVSLTASKSGADISVTTGAAQFNMTGSEMADITQTVPTSVTAINLGTTNTGGNNLGWYAIKNIDVTNSIEISTGDATGTNFNDKKFAVIPPKGCIVVYASGNALFGKALVASVQIATGAVQR